MTTAKGCAVIWDVDGTLVDTAELHFQAWLVLAEELGKPFGRAQFAATFGMRNPEIIPRLFGTAADQEIARLGDRKEELYRWSARQGVELLPGARNLVQALHGAGFQQAIGSSAPRANVDLILEMTRIAPYLTAVVAMEDTSRGKPDPEVFLTAAGRLAIAPGRCVVIEDAPAGVQAARAGGMKCIAVRYVGHHAEQALIDAGADLVVESLQEVSVPMVSRLIG
jgi:beta-phosphoglucomutase